MEHVLASLDIWFRANGLKVNAAKTQLMLLGSPPNLRNIQNIKIKFREHDLLSVSEAKNLGLSFDSTLSWSPHVESVTRRCFGVLSGLSHLRGHLPPSVISALVNALVFSQIRYCISVYGNGTKKNLSRIQKVINYAAKVIFGRKKYDHVSDLMRRLGWLSSTDLTEYHTLSLVHKVRSYGEPEGLAASLTTVADTRDRTTRQNHLLHVPRSRSEMGKRRFCCRGPARYNSLPADMACLPVPAFNRRLRRHLIQAHLAPD